MIPSKPDKPKINPRKMVRDGRQDELYQLICATGYIPDEGNFSDFCQSVLSGFALLACGNPGSGKTVFTDALYEACNLDYYTVTGRDELRQEELLCSWDGREQESFMQEVRPLVEARPEAERARALETAREQRWTGRFLILGEVAAAYAKAESGEFPTLLRLDEADKFGAAIEDALLSPLATGKIYVERLSEAFVGCTNPDFLPIVISTSNDSRHELSLPFRDRHLHTYFAPPSLGKELEILRARCPEIGAANLSQALKLLDAIRSVAGLSHYPSVRTGIQLARAFERDSITEITERNVSVYSLKHVGKNLAISLQEFITLSFLYRKRTIKRILLAFLFQTSALPVQSGLVYLLRQKLARCGLSEKAVALPALVRRHVSPGD